MCGSHQNVVGDFAEGQAQVDDIILCTASLRKIADVNDAARRGLAGCKQLQHKKKQNEI